MSIRILVVEDDPSTSSLIEEILTQAGWDVVISGSGEHALQLTSDQSFDVVLTDIRLPNMSGIEVCRRLTQTRPGMPVIVMTAFGDMELALSALRAGARDFITKPLDPQRSTVMIEAALRAGLRREGVKRLVDAGDASDDRPVGRLMGTSPHMRTVYRLIRRLVGTDTTVLLSGESGTGKELVASALHFEGPRAQAPFVALNCAAVPSALIESELFGHIEGSFTDAKVSRQGLFQQAGAGTLFLDEIADMPVEMQARLLRVLQERQLRPIGGNRTVTIHARIIAATHRDLEAEVAAGRFREDLYYRLNVVQIPMPPLRARGSDISLLAEHFVAKFATKTNKQVSGLTLEARGKLLTYSWPGNVRQLENAMDRAVALTRKSVVGTDDLPETIKDYAACAAASGADALSGLVTLEQQEQHHIRRVLEVVRGNRTRAAQLLGVNRRTLYRKLDRSPGKAG